MQSSEQSDGALVSYGLDEIRELCQAVLMKHGLSSVQSRSVAKVITAGERDECRSHGVYRLPSVPMMMRHRPAGSLPLRAEVTASDGYEYFE